MLQKMDMLVPLNHPEVAECSKTDTFEYVPIHEREYDVFSLLSDSPHDKDVTDECSVYDNTFDEDDNCSSSSFHPEVII